MGDQADPWRSKGIGLFQVHPPLRDLRIELHVSYAYYSLIIFGLVMHPIWAAEPLLMSTLMCLNVLGGTTCIASSHTALKSLTLQQVTAFGCGHGRHGGCPPQVRACSKHQSDYVPLIIAQVALHSVRVLFYSAAEGSSGSSHFSCEVRCSISASSGC